MLVPSVVDDKVGVLIGVEWALCGLDTSSFLHVEDFLAGGSEALTHEDLQHLS